ncbi:MAG: GTPase Era [Chloroherpetonaceae bacterium]|nr:GTPase Era [Chloroherpetonaceae bacterium]
MSNENTNSFRSGFVSLIGEPNAGKSTLLNALLGEKLSIVTPKPQTTRKKVLGIYNSEDSQIVLLDTPGIMSPKYKLHEAMLGIADHARDDSDAILFILDLDAHLSENKPIVQNLAFKRIHQSGKPIILIINKIDKRSQEEVLVSIGNLSKEFEFAEIVPLSARSGFNIQELVKAVRKYLPQNEPLYPTDILSDAPERFFVAEIIREKIFKQFSKEIPYSAEVEVESFKEQFESEGRKELIECAIIVERDSQKAILIGEGGAAIKRVGEAARREIEQFLGRPVFLKLFVKVRKDWRENERMLKGFGYDS